MSTRGSKWALVGAAVLAACVDTPDEPREASGGQGNEAGRGGAAPLGGGASGHASGGRQNPGGGGQAAGRTGSGGQSPTTSGGASPHGGTEPGGLGGDAATGGVGPGGDAGQGAAAGETSGGNAPATGGLSSTGGNAPATGGLSSTGGNAPATGGVSSSGGDASTGGSAAATTGGNGGAATTGGNGGALTTGGVSGSGGAASGSGGNGGSCKRDGKIAVTTLIDGRDTLTISANSIAFQHLSSVGPGMEGSRALATSVVVALDGVTSSTDWCPSWPAASCDTCAGTCGELRVFPLDSAPLLATSFVQGENPRFFPGTISEVSFSCTGPQGFQQAKCSLEQAAASAADYSAVVSFDGDSDGVGPSVYTATLNFKFDPCDPGGSGGGAGNGGAGGGAGNGGAGGGAGNGGAGGGAGSGGAGGSTGGSAPVNTLELSEHEQQVSMMCDAFIPSSFTIKNTGSNPTTWAPHIEPAQLFALQPSGSTLLPGEQVTVIVSPTSLLTRTPIERLGSLTAELTIETEPASTGARQILLQATEQGYFLMAPEETFAPVDFGLVPIGLTAERFIPGDFLFGEVGSADGPGFSSLDLLPNPPPQPSVEPRWGYTVEFAPLETGLHSGTFHYSSMFNGGALLFAGQAVNPICPPKTIELTGTGYFDRTCSLLFDGLPCGENDHCSGGTCFLNISVYTMFPFISTFTVARGAPLQDFVKYASDFGISTDPVNDFNFTVDWGDGSTSAALVDYENGLITLSGTHTYDVAGTYNAQVTAGSDVFQGHDVSSPFVVIVTDN